VIYYAISVNRKRRTLRPQYPIDYRDLGGVLQPHKVTVEVAGQKRVMAVHCIEQNVELPKDKFALPGEMKAPLNKGQKPE